MYGPTRIGFGGPVHSKYSKKPRYHLLLGSGSGCRGGVYWEGQVSLVVVVH